MQKFSILNDPFVWEIHLRSISPSFSSMQCLPLTAGWHDPTLQCNNVWLCWLCREADQGRQVLKSVRVKLYTPQLLPPYRLVPSQTSSPRSISWRPMNGYQFPWQQSVVFIIIYIISECNPFLGIRSLYRWESSPSPFWNIFYIMKPPKLLLHPRLKWNMRRSVTDDSTTLIRQSHWGGNHLQSSCRILLDWWLLIQQRKISWLGEWPLMCRRKFRPHRLLHHTSGITNYKFHITSHRTSGITLYMTPQHTTSHTSHHI